MKIGMVLLIEGNATLGLPRYRDVRNLAIAAEAAQLDSLWLYDHLLFQAGDRTIGQWECFTFLAALAEATERIEMGTLVACTAFRNPALLGKMATALDEVSGGRFTLGLGAGWNEAEFRAFGLPFDHRVARFEEALQIIAPLVREGRVDFRGAYYQAPGCENAPRGPRTEGPPIVVGAFGPRMLRVAVRYADGVNGASPAAVRAACVEAGREPATLAITMPAWAGFPDLGPVPDHMQGSTYRSAAALAEHFCAERDAGVSHMMVDFRPNSSAGLARIAEAVRLFRQERPSAQQ